jgi:hypothetical protein
MFYFCIFYFILLLRDPVFLTQRKMSIVDGAQINGLDCFESAINGGNSSIGPGKV